MQTVLPLQFFRFCDHTSNINKTSAEKAAGGHLLSYENFGFFLLIYVLVCLQ